MASEGIRERRAPYVPYQTLANFLADHKQGLPTRLDTKVLEGIGGTLRSQLLAALKFLSLIDGDKKVSPALQQLVKADGDERKRILADVIRQSYTFVFNDSFDLMKASDSDFRKQFEKTGLSGDVLRKSLTFFLLACGDAGIQYSKFIREPSRRASAKTTRPGQRRAGTTKRAHQGEDNGNVHQDLADDLPDVNATMQELMDYFAPITKWPKAQREMVFTFTEKLIGLMRGR